MEDIIQKYKKEKKIRNISIIVTSLALALSLNILLSSTDSGKYLKASVMNTQIGTIEKSDLYIENIANAGNIMMNIKSSKGINQAKSISFSLVYNKENVVLKDKQIPLDNAEILNLVDNDGYNTMVINFENATNIKAGETLLKIVLEKKENKNESLNILNSNITDNENNLFMLSTSGIEF